MQGTSLSIQELPPPEWDDEEDEVLNFLRQINMIMFSLITCGQHRREDFYRWSLLML